MEINTQEFGFHIAPEDRPYILFRRTLNKGMSKRKARFNKKGEETRAAHPGEFEEIWVKHLISHRVPYDPYTWATPEWALARTQTGNLPVGYGNLDKLPAEYPKEWRTRIVKCINAIKAIADANAHMKEKALKGVEPTKEESNGGNSETTSVQGPAKGKGRKCEGLQEAPGTAGEAADAAGS